MGARLAIYGIAGTARCVGHGIDGRGSNAAEALTDWITKAEKENA
jgi:hypothetical protein